MSMELMSLATITRVDPSYEKGRIHRTRSGLVFHSEVERQAWLWAVEQYQRAERDALTGELVAAEQALARP